MNSPSSERPTRTAPIGPSKGRSERPISEARGQDRPLRGPTLALDKAARDLTGRGHALLDVHAKGQERRARARGLRARRCGEYYGVAEPRRHRATSLLG